MSGAGVPEGARTPDAESDDHTGTPQPSTPDPDTRDPGLQPERTRLAWRRTTLAGAVATVLAMKTSLHGGPTVAGSLICAACCALWLAFLAVAHRRIVTLSSTPHPPSLTPRLATAAVLCTVATAVCAAALVAV
ncbi:MULTISPECIES: DUF202 domain-containing protein [unclassified Streptomyces]|uniref:DUF202 domain-containing protein n=1 Tax=Streptomyces sp. ST1015 TaxID=1848900 RepID=UPI000DDA34F7|nr:DUF202 domain-containing protein [Streptomyces sp. ST1020]QZZ32638.1 DUF202 domain-containing protein [Streptomyces sp. ST1015]